LFVATEGRYSAVCSYDRLSLALQGSGGIAWSPDGSPTPLWERYDLSGTEDRSIRAGYDAAELYVPAFLLLNAELRLELFSIKSPPIFDIGFSVFGFSDIACASRDAEPALYPLYAFGGGIRIELKDPISTGFTFALGVNPEGQPRFTFTGTAGF
jgi:hypothetical protein